MREKPGSVYQRKSDGRWVAAVSIGPRGHRRQIARYGRTREEAEAKLDTIAAPFDRVWQRIAIGPDCWEWTGRRGRDGRGIVKEGKRGTAAARLVWESVNGPIPDGLYVCHHCDNPPCVRPDHLFLGTHLDNMRDMIAKGRAYHQKKARLAAVHVSQTVNPPSDPPPTP